MFDATSLGQMELDVNSSSPRLLPVHQFFLRNNETSLQRETVLFLCSAKNLSVKPVISRIASCFPQGNPLTATYQDNRNSCKLKSSMLGKTSTSAMAQDCVRLCAVNLLTFCRAKEQHSAAPRL